jgi:hypothetical protein
MHGAQLLPSHTRTHTHTHRHEKKIQRIHRCVCIDMSDKSASFTAHMANQPDKSVISELDQCFPGTRIARKKNRCGLKLVGKARSFRLDGKLGTKVASLVVAC